MTDSRGDCLQTYFLARRLDAVEGETNLELWTADDLARHLRLAKKTIRRLDLRGKLPRPVRLGRSVRWRRAEVAAWIRAGCPPRDRWTWEEEQ